MDEGKILITTLDIYPKQKGEQHEKANFYPHTDRNYAGSN